MESLNPDELQDVTVIYLTNLRGLTIEELEELQDEFGELAA